MSKLINLMKVWACLAVVGLALYTYVNRLNKVIGLRMEVPSLEEELKELKEENRRLSYRIDRFESPAHLFQLSRDPRFAHYHYPSAEQVVELRRRERE